MALRSAASSSIPLRGSISATSNSACAISRARSKVMRRTSNDASIRSICSRAEENLLIASPLNGVFVEPHSAGHFCDLLFDLLVPTYAFYVYI